MEQEESWLSYCPCLVCVEQSLRCGLCCCDCFRSEARTVPVVVVVDSTDQGPEETGEKFKGDIVEERSKLLGKNNMAQRDSNGVHTRGKLRTTSAASGGTKSTLYSTFDEFKHKSSNVNDVSSKAPDRAFIIAKHSVYGFFLLKAFKRKKGEHYQLPGGHVDEDDPSPAFAAARELFEETGIDIRNNLSRLSLAVFKDGTTVLKRRMFFLLTLENSDMVGQCKPESGEHFTIALSSEHIGYTFTQSAKTAADMVVLHSGSWCTKAIRKLYLSE